MVSGRGTGDGSIPAGDPNSRTSHSRSGCSQGARAVGDAPRHGAAAQASSARGGRARRRRPRCRRARPARSRHLGGRDGRYSRVIELLVAVGAAILPFIAIIYSLLFLVVQFSSTAFTPRLNLFRDSPIVWRAFSFFTSVIVFCFTTAFAIGKSSRTSVLVPIIAMVLVLVAIAVFRAVQASAFKSIQLASTLSEVARRGREVVDDVYPDQATECPAGSGRPAAAEVRWPGRAATLQAIDVPALVRAPNVRTSSSSSARGPGR
jgi:hypothetical protein